MATTITTTTFGNMHLKQHQQQQQQPQRPLRGISIIIESEQKTKPAGSNIESDEMSLKSQTMLLAFGDNSKSNGSDNDNNLQTLHVDHATNVDLETRYSELASKTTTATVAAAEATAAAAAIKPEIKLYPQLLLRIGQSEANDVVESSNAAAAIDAAATLASTTTTTATSTIISCNVADDVRNVLRAEAIAAETVTGEIEESNNDASQLTLVDWPTSAVTETETETEIETEKETVGINAPQHTVKIQIANAPNVFNLNQSQSHRRLGKQISVVKLNDTQNDTDMILQLNKQQQQQTQTVPQSVTTPYQLCYLVSSGQYSPCETLDSGTGSDFESNKSPSNNKGAPKLELHLKTTRLRVNSSIGKSLTHSHSRAYSLTDDSEECDESSSSLSCDSLHSNEAQPLHKLGALLPSSLLRDIRDREADRDRDRDRDSDRDRDRNEGGEVVTATKIDGRPLQYEADQYYNFHVNELSNFRSFPSGSCSSISSPEYEAIRLPGDAKEQHQDHSKNEEQHEEKEKANENEKEEEDVFAGYKDVHISTLPTSTIRSSKGTVRGVKNRVRNGVATFLQLQQPNVKNFMEKDLGKVVLYTTSMGIIRETYAKCANVKQILRTLLIKFEERDVFMSIEYQQEMRERMKHETIHVPQLFVEGQYIGDADIVERLNETGELRQLLRPYKSIATAFTCQTCGGYRLLPCPSCSGSKKSVHRNHFTAEFVALKCMNCDEVGLVKCPNC